MFSRLRVRTKLLVLLVPALLGLLTFATIGIKQRYEDRTAAQGAVAVTDMQLAADDYLAALQAERLAATAAGVQAAGGDNASDTVSTARSSAQKATDETAETFLSALDSVASLSASTFVSLDPSSTADALRGTVRSIEQVRALARSNDTNARSVIDAYSGMISDFQDQARAIVSNTLGVSRATANLHWLAESSEASSRAAALALSAFAADGGTPAAAEAVEAQQSADSLITLWERDASTKARDTLRSLARKDEYAASDRYVARLGRAEEVMAIDATVDEWFTAFSRRLRTFDTGLIRSLGTSELEAASLNLDTATRSVEIYAGGALLTVLLACAFALMVARSISKSLGKLTDGARDISETQLPALVQRLRTPGSTATAMQFDDIEIDTNDEFREVADALNGLGRAAVEVSNEQAATLRKGIGDIFVNLARRNQSLLDRQIEFIDRLEANEQDPDQLDNLFRLDHLATRMRRNAESLLVLAGAEGPRRRTRNVSMTDVVRVAVGEVEDFARISMLAVEDVTMLGSAAVDLAHLLSELMENGTQYSPPDQIVEVVGRRIADGGYIVSVSDHGVGMNEQQIVEANELLRHPPAVGLSMSRSLGFVVAATLAARHSIGVRIFPGSAGGVIAEVALPPGLIVGMAAPHGAAAAQPTRPAVANPAAPPAGKPMSAPSTPPSRAPQTPQLGSDPHLSSGPLRGAGTGSRTESGPGSGTGSGSRSGPGTSTSTGSGTGSTLPGAPDSAARPLPDAIPAAAFQPKEVVADFPVPTTLETRLPEGVVFETGVYGLLDRKPPATLPQPDPSAPQWFNSPAIPDVDIAVPNEGFGNPHNDGYGDVRNSGHSSSYSDAPGFAAPTESNAVPHTPMIGAPPQERSTQAISPFEGGFADFATPALPPARDRSPSAGSNLPVRRRGATSEPPAEEGPRMVASQRDPAEVRTLLYRYRGGQAAARADHTDGGSGPHTNRAAEQS